MWTSCSSSYRAAPATRRRGERVRDRCERSLPAVRVMRRPFESEARSLGIRTRRVYSTIYRRSRAKKGEGDAAVHI